MACYGLFKGNACESSGTGGRWECKRTTILVLIGDLEKGKSSKYYSSATGGGI